MSRTKWYSWRGVKIKAYNKEDAARKLKFDKPKAMIASEIKYIGKTL